MLGYWNNGIISFGIAGRWQTGRVHHDAQVKKWIASFFKPIFHHSTFPYFNFTAGFINSVINYFLGVRLLEFQQI